MSGGKLPIKESLRVGWSAAKNHLFLYAGIFMTYILTSLLPELSGFLPSTNFVAQIITPLLVAILQIIMGMGVIQIMITIVDGKQPQYQQLFSQYRKFWPYLGVSIVYPLIVFGGLWLLIIPGVIWALKYSFSTYIVIDQKAGVFEALHRSGQITRGYKFQLLGFAILLTIINFVGLLFFGVGLIVTSLITNVAIAYVYRQLSAVSRKL